MRWANGLSAWRGCLPIDNDCVHNNQNKHHKNADHENENHHERDYNF